MQETAVSNRELMEMRWYVDSGGTRPLDFRRLQLLALRDAILKYEEEIYQALHFDLRKSREET